MIGQMRQFLDSTGQLWSEGALVGKVGSVFTRGNMWLPLRPNWRPDDKGKIPCCLQQGTFYF